MVARLRPGAKTEIIPSHSPRPHPARHSFSHGPRDDFNHCAAKGNSLASLPIRQISATNSRPFWGEIAVVGEIRPGKEPPGHPLGRQSNARDLRTISADRKEGHRPSSQGRTLQGPPVALKGCLHLYPFRGNRGSWVPASTQLRAPATPSGTGAARTPQPREGAARSLLARPNAPLVPFSEMSVFDAK